MRTAERFEKILAWFEVNMPVAESELVFHSPFQCLVAVMLSAQCTDKRVNMVTPALFEAFPTPEAMARATSDEVFEYVKSVSYPRSKAEHLVAMAQDVRRRMSCAQLYGTNRLWRWTRTSSASANASD